MPATKTSPSQYIESLNMNGLRGRMLSLRSKRKNAQEILFIYGHHSSLERWWGLAQVLHGFGNVTMPDLPGFGGMDSFYKLGKKPTLDNFADYLASFIKLKYRRKRVIIVGMSYGFVIVTRMLQRNPELQKNVKLVVSLVGFADHEDLNFSKTRYYFYLNSARLLSGRFNSFMFRHLALNRLMLNLVYAKSHNAKHKFNSVESNEQLKYLLDIEVGLWQMNDVRTYMLTTIDLLTFSNCSQQIAVPLWHVATVNDHFLDNAKVEQHLRVIYEDFRQSLINATNHAPTVIADKKAASVMVPKDLSRKIRSLK